MRYFTVTCCLALLAACASTPDAALSGEPEPARARAALATVYVENRTGERLTVAYRITARAGSEVVVGTVDGRDLVELAPLPAGEPVVLVARTADGGQLSLPPRSFAMGTAWTWLIDADSRFQPPGDV